MERHSELVYPRFGRRNEFARAQPLHDRSSRARLGLGVLMAVLFASGPALQRGVPAPFDLVLARSRHVLASLRAAGIDRVHPQPLYAVAPLDLFGAGSGPLRARSRYDWLETLASVGPGRVAASS
jgi:hypothetical protein